MPGGSAVLLEGTAGQEPLKPDSHRPSTASRSLLTSSSELRTVPARLGCCVVWLPSRLLKKHSIQASVVRLCGCGSASKHELLRLSTAEMIWPLTQSLRTTFETSATRHVHCSASPLLLTAIAVSSSDVVTCSADSVVLQWPTVCVENQ